MVEDLEGLASLIFLNKFISDFTSSLYLNASQIDIPNVLLAEDLGLNILSEATLLQDLKFKLTVSSDGKTKFY